MRKTVLCAALLVMLAGIPARATHYRETFGLVMTPVVVTPDGPPTDLARCAVLLGADRESGLGGYVLTLQPGEGDGNHLFVLKDAQMGMTPPPTNFDITFFEDLGSCDPAALRPPAPRTPKWFARLGDESGMIPAGSRHAIVTATDGFGVSFELRIAG